MSLVLETLALLEIPDVHVDLGHVGIFRGLAGDAGLSPVVENDLFAALQRKAVPRSKKCWLTVSSIRPAQPAGRTGATEWWHDVLERVRRGNWPVPVNCHRSTG